MLKSRFRKIFLKLHARPSWNFFGILVVSEVESISYNKFMSLIYAYLTATALLLIVWLVLFLARKDTRREMLLISSVFSVLGLFAEAVYIKDWWRPLLITGTSVGIEDFIFSFSVSGIAAVIYEEVFRKRFKKSAKNVNVPKRRVFVGLVLPLALFFGLFFIFSINSFLSSVIALTVPVLYFWYKRPDLIADSVLSGVLLLIIMTAVYYPVTLLFPNWIHEFWLFENVPPILVLGVPIDDVLWYILLGFYMGPLYEYWGSGRLKLFIEHEKRRRFVTT